MPTRIQSDAARRSARLRHDLAEELERLRADAGLTRAAVARVAGIHPSVISRLEDGDLQPTLETYVRVAAALGGDFSGRVYPTTGPQIHDRHQVRMAELLIGSLHPRWHVTPEVAVRQPARGWVDAVLHELVGRTLVATELESGLRRIEQLLRWSVEKADSLPSSSAWAGWARHGEPATNRLLVVRWTRANRDAAESARRQLREAFPADPRDALDALTGTTPWPGPAMLWARIDLPVPRLATGRD